MSNTTDHVLLHFQKPRRQLQKDAQQVIFDELLCVWNCCETMSFQFLSSEIPMTQTELDYVQMFIHFVPEFSS